MKLTTRLARGWTLARPYFTARNLSLLLTAATGFGILAPERATILRNTLGALLGILSPGAGDIL